MDVIEELKFLRKFTKTILGGGGEGVGSGGGGRVGGGDQGGCERRIKVFVKIQKKKFWGGDRGGVRWGVGLVGWVG